MLVIYGSRIIIAQVKSKGLTQDARMGCETAITTDFKKGIQAAYNQCLRTARMIMSDEYSCTDYMLSRVRMPRADLKIYLLCVTSEDYPALGHQTEHLLENLYTDDALMPPFVCDVFSLDSITEMLDSPLRFFSYIDRRLLFQARIFTDHELTVLGYHLSHNLWINDSIDGVFLPQDCAAALDAAMHVRRVGLSGDSVPEGALTPFVDSILGKLVDELEINPKKAGIDLGVFLLALSPSACKEVGRRISATVTQAAVTLQPQGGSYWVPELRVGMTVCSGYDRAVAQQMLDEAVIRRMSKHSAACWFAVLLDTDSRRPYFVRECGSWERALEDVKRIADKE